MTEQDQIKRLREDLKACADYLCKPATLPSMMKVRCEHNLRNLNNMLGTAEENREYLSAGYLREMLLELEAIDIADPKKQRKVIENTLCLLTNLRSEAA